MNHITQWLNKIANISTDERRTIECYELRHQQDQIILSAWAKHFREQYCPDSVIDDLRAGTNLSRKEYLLQMIFPDQTQVPGPSIRAGDFGELLVADYLEFTLSYWVPRVRMESKAVRNESVKGCDVIGLRFQNFNGPDSPNDELAIYECKAGMTLTNENRLQSAIDDSFKDQLRKAESLNFIKRRLKEKQDQQWRKVERFQNPEDHPYIEINGAVAIFSSNVFTQWNDSISATSVNNHPNATRLKLLVIHGMDLMTFVHALYARAADEA